MYLFYNAAGDHFEKEITAAGYFKQSLCHWFTDNGFNHQVISSLIIHLSVILSIN